MLAKRTALALAALSLIVTGCSSPAASSDAACAAPLTTVSPARAAPGQVVTVSAANMWKGCNDQGSNPKLAPLTDQPVTLTIKGSAVQMGRVSANPATGLAQIKVTLPAVAPGTVSLNIGVAQAAELTVTAK